MPNEKGLTLSKLTEKSDRAVINNIVRDQVKMIDSEIIIAHNAGFNRIEHPLPSNFGINNMDKKEAQLMIYSELISIYTTPENKNGKGFINVSIEISSKDLTALFCVSWVNGMDIEEKKERQQLLAKYLRKKNN